MNNQQTKKIFISGMHCQSCEILLEKNLKEVKGVDSVSVNHKKGTASLCYRGQEPENQEIEKIIHDSGYKIDESAETKKLFSANKHDYLDFGKALLFLFILFVIADTLELGKFLDVNMSKPAGLFTVLIIGLTAGFSTCMALVGGLVLSLSQTFGSFRQHLLFNAGRIISFVVLGGLIGLLGSVFNLSGYTLGLITIATALVMLTLGLQLTGLFPRLSTLTLPRFLTDKIYNRYNNYKNYNNYFSFGLGALTFFLPCGFTQAMQLYAVSSGNFLSGASIMGVFALGTTPGLLGIGGLSSIFKNKSFFQFAGIIVIALALFNFRNGLNLIGISPISPISSMSPITVSSNQQIIRMDQISNGYRPNSFTIIKDVPVKWIINSVNPNSCASSIIIPKLGIRKNLQEGENIIEFTPKDTGQIPFSCSMGMYRGVFSVIESGEN